MFCPNCGIEIVDKAKFCPGCGNKIEQQVAVNTENVVIQQENNIKFVPAICTQCGAEIEVNPNDEAAVCKFCKTPFVVAKAINNYNMAVRGDFNVDSIENVENITIVNKVDDTELVKIMAGNQSLKKFIKDFKEYEASVQIRLIPETVKPSIFSSRRPGTIEDIDQEELCNIVSKYIKEYDVSRDERSLLEFYAYCNEKANEELDEDDRLYDYRELLKETWLLKSKKVLETGKMLYPNNESFRKISPFSKLNLDVVNSLLSSTSTRDIVKTISTIRKYMK